ncbi:MAG: ArsR family transcriptional regulator [Anaerolineales bacterium]|nr:ArsR family transcriptional regulator [Anaerolineales bacterium]
MKTVRQQIWEFIRAHRAATATEISLALQMTEANARRHLGILRSQGLVDIIGKRQLLGQGRPSLVYSISESVLGHNLDRLASALLTELGSSLTGEEYQSMLERLARHMAQGSNSHTSRQIIPAGAGHLTQRLNAAIQRLNEMHYQPRWEAHRDAPHVIFGHCPYAAILADHPELCLLDSYLLEYLTGTAVKQTSRLERDAQGVPQCVFRLLGSRSG